MTTSRTGHADLGLLREPAGRGALLTVVVVTGFLLMLPVWWSYWTLSAAGSGLIRATRRAAHRAAERVPAVRPRAQMGVSLES